MNKGRRWPSLRSTHSTARCSVTFRELQRGNNAHFAACREWITWSSENRSIKRLSRPSDKKVNFSNGENNACVFMTGLNIINPVLGTTNKTISSTAAAAAIITPCWPIQRREIPLWFAGLIVSIRYSSACTMNFRTVRSEVIAITGITFESYSNDLWSTTNLHTRGVNYTAPARLYQRAEKLRARATCSRHD